jgi:tetratricopeptide (TPR) repeat protein
MDPDHQAARAELARQLLDAGALERAVEYASSAAQFKAIAAAYYARGRGDDALKVLQWALDQDPADLETRRQLVRSHLGRGDLDAARALLGGTIADTDLLLALAELELRSGHRQEGREAAARALQQEPARRDEVVHLGLRLVASDAAAAFECVDAATDVAAAEHDFAAAAQQLNDYAALAPGHVPALMKLVEVCVDGGLDAEMYAAQARLADAYLEHGQAAEARVIAEDLFAREPWEPSNIERFRRALQLLGEPDPDSVIADRLSGDSPFTSTDLTLDFSFNELARVDEAAPSLVEAPEAEPVASAAPTSGDERPAVAASPGPPSGIDVQDADGEAGEAIEIDLGDTFGAGAESMAAARENAAPVPAALAGLEKVFEGFREEATRHDVLDPAAQLQQGLALEESGQTERAVRLFERAARSPRQRLRAATELARIYRRLGRTRESIEWLERAVESSLPGTEESRELLYDLGLLLAGAGETERALAVLLELKADVPDYRDVARQVARLSQKA